MNYSGFLQSGQIEAPIEIVPQLPHCFSVDVPAVLWGCADDDAVSDARIKTYQTMLIMMKLCGISRYWGLYPRTFTSPLHVWVPQIGCKYIILGSMLIISY